MAINSVNSVNTNIKNNQPKDVMIKHPRLGDVSMNKMAADPSALCKPLPAKGYLVQGGIKNFPKNFMFDAKYMANSVVRSFKGTAKDHEIGKVNDFGLRLAGLGLAGYLMTKKTTMKTKAMELIGLGTFFGAMSVWPKLSMSLPSKAVHGFDPNQEYIDSQGRKKALYMDTQYIPQLYSQEQLDKTADKMGIPKDTLDRNEAVQTRMQKIATKFNALWMMTAGVATAVFSALASNGAERVIEPVIESKNLKKADDILNNFETARKKHESPNITNELNKIFNENNGAELNPELIGKIGAVITKDMDENAAKGMREDLNNLLSGKHSRASESVAADISKQLEEGFKEIPGLSEVIPTKEELVKLFDEKEFMYKKVETPANTVTQANGIEASQAKPTITKVKVDLDDDKKIELQEAVIDFILEKAEKGKPGKDGAAAEPINLNFFAKRTLKSLAAEACMDSLNKTSAAVLDRDKMDTLRKVGSAVAKLNAGVATIDDYTQITVADRSETILANFWNRNANKLVSTLGITAKEIEQAKISRDTTQTLIRDKFEKITSDDAKYEEVMTKLVGCMAELDEKIKPEDTNKFMEMTNKVYGDASNELKNLGMERTATKLTEDSIGGKGSSKNIKQDFYKKRVLGVKNSYARFIHTLDTYRRISKYQFGPELNGEKREVKEAILDCAKEITLAGHSVDQSIKFIYNRNPQPNEDRSEVEVVNGKVINKYHNKEKGVNVPNDIHFYQQVMTLMYGGDQDATTRKILDKANIPNAIKDYSQEMYVKYGIAEYFALPNHKVKFDASSPEAKAILEKHKSSPEDRFFALGVAPDEMMHKIINENYNSSTWLKKFGTAGAVLSGLTLLAGGLFAGTKKV